MTVEDIAVAQAETILIAVTDGVLADSLRFSLELEGFETRFCDEHSLWATLRAPCVRGACLVLDQDVFARMSDGKTTPPFADQDVPVILMVSHTTKQVLARAAAAGVSQVVEKPLLEGDLFDAINQAIDKTGHYGQAGGPA